MSDLARLNGHLGIAGQTNPLSRLYKHLRHQMLRRADPTLQRQRDESELGAVGPVDWRGAQSLSSTYQLYLSVIPFSPIL